MTFLPKTPLHIAVVIAAICCIGVGLVLWSGAVSSASTTTLRGSLLLAGENGVEADACDLGLDPQDELDCLDEQIARLDGLRDGESYPLPEGPGGGFADLRDGAQVVVRGADGDPLTVGELREGRVDQEGVHFAFDLAGLPEESIYQVSIGSRDPYVLPREQLEKDGWKVALSLG